MEFIKEPNRVYAVAGGRTVAEVTFPDLGVDAVAIDHTFVDDSLRGQGVASQLLSAAAEVIESRGKKAVPKCSYAVAWFAKHSERANLL